MHMKILCIKYVRNIAHLNLASTKCRGNNNNNNAHCAWNCGNIMLHMMKGHIFIGYQIRRCTKDIHNPLDRLFCTVYRWSRGLYT